MSMAVAAFTSLRTAFHHRCQPERPLFYRTVRTHLATWLERVSVMQYSAHAGNLSVVT